MARRRLLRDPDNGVDPDDPDGNVDAWTEPGSDELMPFELLARIRQEAIEVELVRARRLERLGE